MRVGRRIGLLAILAAVLAGCRADGTGSLSMLPRRGPSPPSFDLDGFIDEHNKNAEAIGSVEARPSINVASATPMRKMFKANLSGHLALERPRNFKLELEAEGVPKADLGSNAQEFWYWVSSPDRDQKYIYWCNYRDLDTSDLPITYQPDWIIEAMGLKPISAREVATVKVERGSESGTTRLIFPAARDRGQPYSREMIVGNTDRHIRRLKVFSESRVLLAEAVAEDFQTFPTGTAGPGERESGYLPQKVRLDWRREQLVLDVALREVKVNQFDHAMAADIFVEPDVIGYTRLNLAEASRGDRSSERRTRTRQSLPPPEPRDDVHLGRPSPMKEDDNPALPKVGRRTPRPQPEEDDAPAPALEPVVGTPIPHAPGPPPLQASTIPGPPGRDSTIEQ